jgi:hypothetical protein
MLQIFLKMADNKHVMNIQKNVYLLRKQCKNLVQNIKLITNNIDVNCNQNTIKHCTASLVQSSWVLHDYLFELREKIQVINEIPKDNYDDEEYEIKN